MQIGQILVSRTTEGFRMVSFYQVMRSTSNTCEIREIKKSIVSQIHDEQEVKPLKDNFISESIRRKILPTGCIMISRNLYAWPWSGKSHWQASLIFIP